MKGRYLSVGEKRDVEKAVRAFMQSEYPGRIIHVEVEDETDDRGIPQYRATVGGKIEDDDEVNEGTGTE
jgi:hypothetical protein